MPVQPPAESRSALGSDQVVQGLNESSLENLQEWTWHNLSGKTVAA